MKPIEFSEQTTIIARDQSEYIPLPAYQTFDEHGTLIFCWKVSWRERLQILFVGKIWHRVLTFNKALQPQVLETKYPFIAKPEA